MADSALFPKTVTVDDTDVSGFCRAGDLIDRLLYEIEQPGTRLAGYVNVHVLNTARRNRQLRTFLQAARFIYCDGAGVVMGSKLMGQPLPGRLTAADWLPDLIEALARQGKTVYLLGGAPGVSATMVEFLDEMVPEHRVCGHHHGYILKDPQLERQVLEEINTLKPDLLIVGFGSPLQEQWALENLERIDAGLILPLGAVMDYFTGQLPRCPQWMGHIGLEWAFRLAAEPRRLFRRYVLGNPEFLGRVALQALRHRTRLSLARLRS